MSGANPFESLDPFRGALADMCGRVRMARHAAIAGDAEASFSLISAEEQNSVSRLRQANLRSDRVAHYIARRRLLADLTGRDAPVLTISHTTRGAPELTWHGAPPISLSRSGGWTCVGVGLGGKVGVDIEVVGPRNWRPMLDMMCTATQAAAWTAFLERHDEPATAFLWLWTAKEAVLKADGRGFGAGAKFVHILPQAFSANRTALIVPAFSQTFNVWTAQAEDALVSFATAPDTLD